MTSPRGTTFQIEDVQVLEVLNNPLRLRMLDHLAAEPRTVRELAGSLGVPVTRLYYHLDTLEEVGVIQVVEVRKSGARLQRVYQAVATHFQPGPGLLDKVEDKRQLAEAVTGLVLDGARLDAVAGLLRQFSGEGTAASDEVPGSVGRTMVPLTREAALEVTEKLADLVAEMNEKADRRGEEYAFSFVLFPMVARVRGEGL